jgi:hypothetical protein
MRLWQLASDPTAAASVPVLNLEAAPWLGVSGGRNAAGTRRNASRTAAHPTRACLSSGLLPRFDSDGRLQQAPHDPIPSRIPCSAAAVAGPAGHSWGNCGLALRLAQY